MEKPQDVEGLQVPIPETAPALSRMLQFARLARNKGFAASIPGDSPMGIAGSVLGTEILFRWLHKRAGVRSQALASGHRLPPANC